MSEIKWVDKDQPKLRSPKLIVAFEGWNDAGESATMAVHHIQDRLAGELFAEIDPQKFYDFTETRPMIQLGKKTGREIVWPSNEFTTISLPDFDLITFVGVEPQLRWRAYIDQIMSIVDQFEVELVVSLGALIAEVAHSRPITVYTASYDPQVMKDYSLEPSNYEGPTGIVGVLQNTLVQANVSSLSLWTAIPGYAPHIASPKAALALVERVSQIIEHDIPKSLLEVSTATYEKLIDKLAEEDDELLGYITELEQKYDESMGPDSGKALIAELEHFLRNRGE